MSTIDCGPLKVFNPGTGKCIMKEGATAVKLRRLGVKLDRHGACEGNVVMSKSGNPYCKPKTILLHANLPRGRNSVINVMRSGCKVQEKEIQYLKKLRARNQKNIDDASSRITRLTGQLDTALRAIEKMSLTQGTTPPRSSSSSSSSSSRSRNTSKSRYPRRTASSAAGSSAASSAASSMGASMGAPVPQSIKRQLSTGSLGGAGTKRQRTRPNSPPGNERNGRRQMVS